jgi:hypothetical protein
MRGTEMPCGLHPFVRSRTKPRTYTPATQSGVCGLVRLRMRKQYAASIVQFATKQDLLSVFRTVS